MEMDDDDDFFVGGGNEIPGIEEPAESDELVKMRNRSYDVSVPSLAEEFRRSWNEKSEDDGYFLDNLLEEVRRSELDMEVFERNLKDELHKFYIICLGAQKKFPLKMKRLHDEICGTFPNENVEFISRNKFFARKEYFDEGIIETIDQCKAELKMTIEWERNEFVIKKMEAKHDTSGGITATFADVGNVRSSRRQLEFMEVREYITPARILNRLVEFRLKS